MRKQFFINLEMNSYFYLFSFVLLLSVVPSSWAQQSTENLSDLQIDKGDVIVHYPTSDETSSISTEEHEYGLVYGDLPKFNTSQSPKKQISAGVTPENISCKNGLDLIFKLSDGSPACVKLATANKIINHGWWRVYTTASQYFPPTPEGWNIKSGIQFCEKCGWGITDGETRGFLGSNEEQIAVSIRVIDTAENAIKFYKYSIRGPLATQYTQGPLADVVEVSTIESINADQCNAKKIYMPNINSSRFIVQCQTDAYYYVVYQPVPVPDPNEYENFVIDFANHIGKRINSQFDLHLIQTENISNKTTSHYNVD